MTDDQPRDQYIKVNLPDSRKSYGYGNGEGVWVLVDAETKAAHDADVEGGLYRGTLDNDSLYWPGLSHGDEVVFEMRGENRPVVSYDWLEARSLGEVPTSESVIGAARARREEEWQPIAVARHGEPDDKVVTAQDVLAAAAAQPVHVYYATREAPDAERLPRPAAIVAIDVWDGPRMVIVSPISVINAFGEVTYSARLTRRECDRYGLVERGMGIDAGDPPGGAAAAAALVPDPPGPKVPSMPTAAEVIMRASTMARSIAPEERPCRPGAPSRGLGR